jgi:small conductance mechanosensitive channel
MVNETIAVNGVVETAQSYVYTITIGIVILLVGFSLGVLAKKFLLRVLKEVELNKIITKVGITYNLEKWISNIISFVIYFFTIIFFLEQFNIKSIWILYLIAGAILMLVILTFLVGIKDIIPNLIGWIIIQKKGKIKEGKSVEIKEIQGIVEKVGFLETEIKTENGDVLYLPNSLFIKSKFKLKKT